jgi:uncharacterized integral membrane protein
MTELLGTGPAPGRENAMVGPTPQEPGARRRRLSSGAIASLGGGGLLVIFIVQNTEKVRLHFLVWTFTWPLWLYTIVTAVFGAIVWLGLGVMRRHRRRKERRELRRGE